MKKNSIQNINFNVRFYFRQVSQEVTDLSAAERMSDIEVQIELQLDNSLSEEQALGARRQEDVSGERRSDGPEGKQGSGQRGQTPSVHQRRLSELRAKFLTHNSSHIQFERVQIKRPHYPLFFKSN